MDCKHLTALNSGEKFLNMVRRMIHPTIPAFHVSVILPFCSLTNVLPSMDKEFGTQVYSLISLIVYSL